MQPHSTSNLVSTLYASPSLSLSSLYIYSSNVVLYQLDPLSSPPPRMLPLLQALSDYPIQYLSSFNNNGNDKQPAKLNQTEQVNKTGGLKQSSPDTRNTSVDNNRNQGGESHATENKPTQNEVALCAEDAIVGYSGATVSWNEAKAFLTHVGFNI